MEERIGEVHERRMVFGDRLNRAGPTKLVRPAQALAAPAGLEESLDQCPGSGDQVIVAVDRVEGTDLIAGRRQQRHLVPVDLYGLLVGVLLAIQGIVPLLQDLVLQHVRVAGFEEDADGGPLAKKRIGSQDHHVGDDRIAQQVGQRRLLQGQLPLDPPHDAIVQSADGGQIANIRPPVFDRASQPGEVGKAAATEIEAFYRHVKGDRLDGHVVGNVRQLHRRYGGRLRERPVGHFHGLRTLQQHPVLGRHPHRLGTRKQGEYLIDVFPVGPGGRPLRQIEVEPSGKRGRQIVSHQRRAGIPSGNVVGRGRVAIPPRCQQRTVGGLVDDRSDGHAVTAVRPHIQLQRLVSPEEEIDRQPAGTSFLLRRGKPNASPFERRIESPSLWIDQLHQRVRCPFGLGIQIDGYLAHAKRLTGNRFGLLGMSDRGRKHRPQKRQHERQASSTVDAHDLNLLG